MEPSLNIPFSFARENFSQGWWDETATVLARLGLDFALADPIAAETTEGDEFIGADELDEEGELPDLSPAQARKLVNNVSDRLKTTFKIIAQAPEAGFTVRDVAQALGDENEGTLRGIWSGITRRLRSVLGDGEAYLFQWEEDESGVTWKGMVSPTTHRSLRKALGVE